MKKSLLALSILLALVTPGLAKTKKARKSENKSPAFNYKFKKGDTGVFYRQDYPGVCGYVIDGSTVSETEFYRVLPHFPPPGWCKSPSVM